MLSFKRPSSSDRTGGHKLPMPLKSLEKMGVAIRRSEVSMIAGVPGAGKSALAMNLALFAKVPTLYVAADTSEWTMRMRTLAALTGETQAMCERAMVNGLDPAAFADADHMAWVFESDPSIDAIRLEIAAYVEVHGVAPELVVVDNLIDISEDGSDEWQALRRTMKGLKKLARQYDTAVLVLHHTSEASQIKILHAPPRSAIQGKVAQLPALILTVDNSRQPEVMAVGIVKNRYGMANPNGSYGPALEFDGSRMTVTDKRMRF